jgi:hypothetical protein
MSSRADTAALSDGLFVYGGLNRMRNSWTGRTCISALRLS